MRKWGRHVSLCLQYALPCNILGSPAEWRKRQIWAAPEDPAVTICEGLAQLLSGREGSSKQLPTKRPSWQEVPPLALSFQHRKLPVVRPYSSCAFYHQRAKQSGRDRQREEERTGSDKRRSGALPRILLKSYLILQAACLPTAWKSIYFTCLCFNHRLHISEVLCLLGKSLNFHINS